MPITPTYFLKNEKGEISQRSVSLRKDEGFISDTKKKAKFYLGKFKQFKDIRDTLLYAIHPYSKEAYNAITMAYKKSKKFEILSDKNNILVGLDSGTIGKDARFRLQNGVQVVFQKEKSTIRIDFSDYRENLDESRKSSLKKILVSKDFTDKTKRILYKSEDGTTILAAGRSTKFDKMDVIQIVLSDLKGSFQSDETEMRDPDTAKYIARKLAYYIDDQQMFVKKALEFGLKVSNVGNFYNPVSYYHGMPHLYWGYMGRPDFMLDRHPPKGRMGRGRRDIFARPLPHGSLDEPGKVPGSVPVENPPVIDVQDIPDISAMEIIPDSSADAGISSGNGDSGVSAIDAGSMAASEELVLKVRNGKELRLKKGILR